MLRLPIAAVLLASLLTGCVSDQQAELTDERICLYHHANNPAEQARCRVDAPLRDGSPPDVTAKELPERPESLSH